MIRRTQSHVQGLQVLIQEILGVQPTARRSDSEVSRKGVSHLELVEMSLRCVSITYIPLEEQKPS